MLCTAMLMHARFAGSERIKGQLPEQLPQLLPSLTSLQLVGTGLGGTVPAIWFEAGEWELLSQLDIRQNAALKGTALSVVLIPACLLIRSPKAPCHLPNTGPHSTCCRMWTASMRGVKELGAWPCHGEVAAVIPSACSIVQGCTVWPNVAPWHQLVCMSVHFITLCLLCVPLLCVLPALCKCHYALQASAQ